ncbi:MAG: aminotransferase class V-fold PLP-dependent enzyme [Gemmatimonadetes bacterium]|nr:aminotransferase class V-fold PLP-dependent enzyme [Gemmatimonadota bacterium]
MTVHAAEKAGQAGAGRPGYDVAELRRVEFPWADEAIFLNHAGIGPLPERVRSTLEAYGRDRAAAHRLTEDHLFKVLDRSREVAARLLNADPSEIALSTNTSFGINLAALALPLEAGDIVLLSDQEFPANVFPWRQLARRGVTVELVPVTDRGWPDEARMLERLADPRVKVLALSLVQFHTGYLADLAAFSAATRATGTYFVVDAIQGLGQVPFDVRATPVDILACGAQKWLLSPWGSGFTYVRRDLIERLEPPLAGWTAFEGTDDLTTLCSYRGDWRRDARRFELITLPFQDFLGMNGSIGLLLELGIDAIRDHLRRINRPVIDWAERRGVRLSSPVGAHESGMVCLVPPDPASAYARLTEAGVVASLREGAVRLSPHCYNTIDEMARVAELLDRIV